jgi:hypothetical protein
MRNLWKYKKLFLIALFFCLYGCHELRCENILLENTFCAGIDTLNETISSPLSSTKDETRSEIKGSGIDSINYTRFAIVSGGLLGLGTAVHFYQLNAWWKNWRRPFHFQEDLIYGKNVDKVGHAWGAAFCSFVLTKSYRWAGISEETSIWIGAIGGSMFQLYVEFEDGYSQWGFDRVDAAGDIVGGFYPLLQYYVPEFKNYKIKASYYPRQLGKQGGIPGQKHAMLDDYEGQTFWLSIKTGRLFPEIFPKFLNLSVGYSVRNLNNQAIQYGIVLIAPDVDFTEIFPNSCGFLKTVCETLDYYKFPTPAIQISPKLILFGLYY